MNDLFVYRSYAEPVLAGALPYRDVFSEYPPLASPAIVLPGLVGTGPGGLPARVRGLDPPAGSRGGPALRSPGRAHRRRPRAAPCSPRRSRRLLCGALRAHPLRPRAGRADAGGAAGFCVGARPRAGMAVLGLGAMTKFFPLLIAPVALAWLVGRGRRREAWQGAAALLAVLAPARRRRRSRPPRRAPLDALRYHLDRPVQVESTAGAGAAGARRGRPRGRRERRQPPLGRARAPGGRAGERRVRRGPGRRDRAARAVRGEAARSTESWFWPRWPP